jgi:hypothetical protein
MPQYFQPGQAEATALGKQAGALCLEGTGMGRTPTTTSVRTFLATVLFLVGLAGHPRV